MPPLFYDRTPLKGSSSAKLTVFCIVVFLLGSTHSTTSASNSNKILYRNEVFNQNYQVEWKVDFRNRTIEFTTTVRTIGYIGFGISYTGGMTSSDIVIGGIFPNGTSYFSDCYATGESMPLEDKSQDWKLISGSENSTHTTLKFYRLLETCDKYDIPIKEESLKMIWAYGESDEISYHDFDRGISAVNLLDPANVHFDLSQYKVWRIVKDQTMSSADTTYMCTFFQEPSLSKKNHIIGFNIISNTPQSKRHIHHADLYRCKAPKGQNPTKFFSKYLEKTYDCYSDKEDFPVEHCQLFEFAWGIGGKVTIFPDNIGVPIGENTDEFYMMEIHYDNPKRVKNVKVQSGMEFYYTDKLRPFEAGFLSVGTMTSKTYSLTIPPNTDKFVLNSHCPSECTKVIPEQDGINVFMFILHSHLSGRQQRLRHFRNGIELPFIADDENIDFNYQNSRLLRNHVKVLPGDHLTIECTYSTKWKNGSTVIGGRPTTSEMCLAFLMYYPRTDTINQCGSYFPQLKMLKYMGIDNVTSDKGEMDPKVTFPTTHKGKLYSEVVKSINWSDKKRAEFQELFRHSDHQSYCYPYHIEEIERTPFVMTNYPKIIQEYKTQSSC